MKKEHCPLGSLARATDEPRDTGRSLGRASSRCNPAIRRIVEQLVHGFEEIVDRKLDERLAAVPAKTRLIDLAKLGPSKRLVYRDARTGKIKGAVKIGRSWFAPESAAEGWIASHIANPSRSADNTGGVSFIDGARERLGLRRVG
jgi:hypothetical protein